MTDNNIILSQIDKEVLAQELANKAANTIIDKLRPLLPTQDRVELTRNQVADKLNRSLVTIDKYTRDGILTRYKRGGRYFYYQDEVEAARTEMENPRFVTGKHNYLSQ